MTRFEPNGGGDVSRSDLTDIRMTARIGALKKNGDLGAAYKRGPQGNEVVDWHAEYVERYGEGKNVKITSSVQDRRDTSDPNDVGQRLLDERKAQRATSSNGKDEH